MLPLPWVLALAAALFCTGLYAVLARRNGVTILMGVVLMLNGVIVNLVAFWRYRELETAGGQVFGLATAVIAVAQVVVGLGLLIALWRRHGVSVVDEMDALREQGGA